MRNFRMGLCSVKYRKQNLKKNNTLPEGKLLVSNYNCDPIKYSSSSHSKSQDERSYSEQPSSSIDARDLYEVLDITPDATSTEIREAFFRKAKVFHPDIDPSTKARQEFLKAREAYQILSNTLERHEYDKLIMGTDITGVTRMTGLNEEQEKHAREKAREDQEVFYSTKQEVRKERYGISRKWGNEYEWFVKVIGGGGSNLRLTADVEKIKRNDDKPYVPSKYSLFLDKHIFDHGELDATEAKKRNIQTLGVVSFFLCIVYASRLL